jgi:hypothetical protein
MLQPQPTLYWKQGTIHQFNISNTSSHPTGGSDASKLHWHFDWKSKNTAILGAYARRRLSGNTAKSGFQNDFVNTTENINQQKVVIVTYILFIFVHR